ncbi:MAG TPA: ABC transporter permease [Fibrobacteraceae bacterium]|nr:ABC transporter permease [Fibrobacteraceae bacterium]
MISNLLSTAFRNIMRNRMRTLLTMLGIIIGVAAVIIMVGIGKGAEADINSRIKSLGTNVLMIHAAAMSSKGVHQGADSRNSLKITDLDVLRKEAPRLIAVSGMVRSSSLVVANNKNWSTSVQGVNPDYQTIKDWKVQSGTFFSDRDVRTARKVVVLGKTVAKEIFGDEDPVGKKIRVGKIPCQVIGIMAEKGQSGMGDDQDDVVLAPLLTVYYRFSGENHLGQILASTATMEEMDSAETEVTRALRKAHRLAASEDDDFDIRSQSEIMQTATSMSKTLTLLLSAIAAVSLLVGGIGIMNIMLVSVTERTREIGIRMAIGARGFDILVQFLLEAVVLCSLGGAIGVGIAAATCKAVTKWVGMATVLDGTTIAMAFAFSAVVGVFFGFYPARKASQLNPIEALRYE